MAELGWVQEVSTRNLGAHVTVAAGIGSQTLWITSIADFASADQGGGDILINGEVLAYSDFTGSDETGWSLKLPVGLGVAAAEDDEVLVSPVEEEKKALVQLGDDPEGKTCIIDHGLHNKFEDGIRTEDLQENVVIETRGSERYIVDILATTPDVDGEYIDPATLPAGSGAATDGLAPPAITVIEADGGIEALFLSWAAVTSPDPVTYDVYVGTAAGFVADGTTLAGSTESTVFVKSFAPGTYFAKVFARDADGTSAASPEVTATVVAPVDEVALQAQIDANEAAVQERPRAIFAAAQPVLTATEKAVWYDTDNGYAASYWNGTTWSPYSLGTGAFAANAVTTAIIAPLAVTAAQVAAAAVTTAKIAADAVTAAEIAAGAVGSGELAVGAVIAGKIAAGAIVAGDIAAGAITTAKLAAGAVTATEIAAGAIVAGKIAAGAVTATEIAAGAITTNKLSVIIGGGNLLPDSSFEGLTSSIWTGGSAPGTNVSTRAWQGTRSLQVGCTDAAADQYREGSLTGLAANTTYTVTARLWVPATWTAAASPTNVGANGQFLWVIDYSNGTNVVIAPTDLSKRDQWQLVKATITTGPTTTGLALRLYGATTNIWFDTVQLELGDVPTAWGPKPDEILPGTVAANMIQAGAVIAGKIAAGAIVAGDIAADTITAAQIAADAITVTELAAGAVTAVKIAAGTITANEIAASTITAAKIASGTITATQIASGTITATQIAAGAITGDKLTATAIDGKTITGALFKTAASGERLEINTVFDDGTGPKSVNSIWAYTGETYAGQPGALQVDAATAAAGAVSENQFLTIRSPSHSLESTRRSRFYLQAYKDANAAGAIRTSAWMDSDFCRMTSAVKNIIEGPSEFNSKITVTGDVIASTGLFDTSYVGGGGTAANINNNGRVIRAASTRELKKNIKPLTLTEAQKVLLMEPQSFKWKKHLDMGDDTQGGFLADQAQEVGADLWVTHREDGKPTGIRYGEITAAHNLLIRDLYEKARAVDDLTARLDRIEKQLAKVS